MTQLLKQLEEISYKLAELRHTYHEGYYGENCEMCWYQWQEANTINIQTGEAEFNSFLYDLERLGE